MTLKGRHLALASLVAGVLSAAPSAARADVPLVESDRHSFTLGGYLRTLSAAQRWDATGLPDVLGGPSVTGVNAGVGRLEWTASLGDHVILDLHQRLSWRVEGASPLSGGSPFGVGVTRVPNGNVSMRTVLLDVPGTSADHDIDRASIRLHAGSVDIVLGRQAMAWGSSLIFPVADIWTRLSPWDLDNVERRGVDGARVIWAPSFATEVEFVVVDRGHARDVGAGVRATVYGARSDVFVAAAKNYDTLLAAGGWVRDLGRVSLRGEVLLPIDLSDAPLAPGEGVDTAAWEGPVRVEPPRATVGVEHYTGDWVIMAEAHFNGAGEGDAERYAAHALTSEELARGEVYLMGRTYVGSTVMHAPTPVVSWSLGAIMNVEDPSALLTPSFNWGVAQDVDVNLGAFIPVGAGLRSALPPEIGSEFGIAPLMVYAQIAAYY